MPRNSESDSYESSDSHDGRHDRSHGDHDGRHGDRSSHSCEESRSDSREGCDSDEYSSAGLQFCFFLVMLAVVITITVIVLCILKKRAKRTRSVSNLRVITVPAEPLQTKVTTPHSAVIMVPHFHPKSLEAELTLPLPTAPVHQLSGQPTLPMAVTVAPPEYTSTVDLREPQPDLRATIASPPPQYDA